MTSRVRSLPRHCSSRWLRSFASRGTHCVGQRLYRRREICRL